jgi:sugar phosphate isomerase/epimerase
VSLAPVRTAGEARALQEQLREQGREPLFELSYTMDESFLRDASFLRGSVLSVHAPCPGAGFFPNVASRDPAVRRDGVEVVRRSAATAARFGARLVVLHPGYTLDSAVPVDMGRRLFDLADLPDEERGQVWLADGSICRRGYCARPSYRARLASAAEGLASAEAACRAEGVELAVENLNPRITYMFQLPSELVELVRTLPAIRVCVDIGHLWISSLAHGFAFGDGLDAILATGRVRSAHIHDNTSRLTPLPMLADEHAPVGSGTVPVRDALAALVRAGVPAVIVETATLLQENTARVIALLSPGT